MRKSSSPYRVQQKNQRLARKRYQKWKRHDENIKIDHSDHERSEGWYRTVPIKFQNNLSENQWDRAGIRIFSVRHFFQ